MVSYIYLDPQLKYGATAMWTIIINIVVPFYAAVCCTMLYIHVYTCSALCLVLC